MFVKTKNTEKRFLEKIKVVESGCHEWQSTIHRDGYGKFWHDGFQVPAHRMSYTLFKGEIPEKMLICHTCDNRKCVNPEHLYAGTHSQNTLDKVSRYKGNWGAMKFTPEQILQVKILHESGLTQTKIASIVGMNQTSVSRFLRGVGRANQQKDN